MRQIEPLVELVGFSAQSLIEFTPLDIAIRTLLHGLRLSSGDQWGVGY